MWQGVVMEPAKMVRWDVEKIHEFSLRHGTGHKRLANACHNVL
jgi:hypothetical protein